MDPSVWPQYVVEPQYVEGFFEVDSLIWFFCLRINDAEPELMHLR